MRRKIVDVDTNSALIVQLPLGVQSRAFCLVSPCSVLLMMVIRFSISESCTLWWPSFILRSIVSAICCWRTGRTLKDRTWRLLTTCSFSWGSMWLETTFLSLMTSEFGWCWSLLVYCRRLMNLNLDSNRKLTQTLSWLCNFLLESRAKPSAPSVEDPCGWRQPFLVQRLRTWGQFFPFLVQISDQNYSLGFPASAAWSKLKQTA